MPEGELVEWYVAGGGGVGRGAPEGGVRKGTGQRVGQGGRAAGSRGWGSRGGGGWMWWPLYPVLSSLGGGGCLHTLGASRMARDGGQGTPGGEGSGCNDCP